MNYWIKLYFFMLVKFGAYVVDQSQIFFKSSFVLGLVNIKPVVPGRKFIMEYLSQMSLLSLEES